MKNRGFTSIELLMTILITVIIVMIAIPNYIRAQGRSRLATIKGNMHIIQFCVEAYAVDFDGAYPTDVNSVGQGFGFYFPGGDEDMQTVIGRFPINPYTNVPMVYADFLIYCYACPSDNADNTISGSNDVDLAGPGRIRYGVYSIMGAWPWTEYGIVGSGRNRLSVRSQTAIYVLHN